MRRDGWQAAVGGLVLTLAPLSGPVAEMGQEGRERTASLAETREESAIPCSELNIRAMEASLVIGEHARALAVGVEQAGSAQALVLLGWLDHWSGRLRGLVDLAQSVQCLDESEAETYQRALVTAVQIGNRIREELLRGIRRLSPERSRDRRF